MVTSSLSSCHYYFDEQHLHAIHIAPVVMSHSTLITSSTRLPSLRTGESNDEVATRRRSKLTRHDNLCSDLQPSSHPSSTVQPHHRLHLPPRLRRHPHRDPCTPRRPRSSQSARSSPVRKRPRTSPSVPNVLVKMFKGSSTPSWATSDPRPRWADFSLVSSSSSSSREAGTPGAPPTSMPRSGPSTSVVY